MRIAIINTLVSVALLSAASGRLPGQTIPEKSAENIKSLVAVLNSDATVKEKMAACRQLAVIGDEQAVGALAALLGDEKLSHMARYALEPIPGRQVDEAFRDALKTLKGKQLVGVIGSVGARRDSKAVSQLAVLLKSSDQEVADASALALGKIADRRAVRVLEGALSDTRAESQSAIAEGLFRAAEALSSRGDRSAAIRIYDQLLARSRAHQVRTGALRGTILARGTGGVALLEQNLKGEDPVLFLAAVRTTHEIPGKQVSEVLISELSRPLADRQIPIIQALGKRKETAASTVLAQIAQNGELPVRVQAIRTLAEIGTPEAVPPLFRLLGDADAKVAATAREALAGFPGTVADDALLAMVKSPEIAQQIAAIDLIQLRRTKAALPALKKSAQGRDPRVRRRALEAVGKVGEPADLSFLLTCFPALRDAEDIRIMEAAVLDLGIRSSDREAYARSLTEMQDLTPEQSASVLRVLGALGGKNALAAVRASLKDGKGEVRDAALRALASWKTPDAAPELLATARTTGDPTEKVLCLRGFLRLCSHNDLSVDQRVSMAAEAEPLIAGVQEKRMLMSVLQRTASARAMSLAARYLDDPEVKEEASVAATTIAESVVEQDPSAVRPIMEKVLKTTEHEQVGERARGVLEKARKILN